MMGEESLETAETSIKSCVCNHFLIYETTTLGFFCSLVEEKCSERCINLLQEVNVTGRQCDVRCMLCHASPHLAPCVRDETLDEVLQAAERLDPLVSFLPTACSRRTDPHPIPHRIDREFGCLLMEDFGRSWTSPNLPRCVTGRSLTPSLPFGSYNFYKGFASLTSCCCRQAGRFLKS